MSILLCGDPHGAYEIRNGQLRAKDEGCNDVIFLGDCWNINQDYPDGPRVWTLPGNHEHPTHKDFLTEQGAVIGPFSNHFPLQRDGVSIKVQNIDIFTVGGIDLRSHKEHLMPINPWLYSQVMHSGEDIACFDPERVEARAMAADFDIFLTHDAPYPMELPTNRAGSDLLTKIINEKQPNFHLNGHMHRFRHAVFGKTISYALDQMGGWGPSMAIMEDADTVTILEEPL